MSNVGNMCSVCGLCVCVCRVSGWCFSRELEKDSVMSKITESFLDRKEKHDSDTSNTHTHNPHIRTRRCLKIKKKLKLFKEIEVSIKVLIGLVAQSSQLNIHCLF